MLTDAAHVPRPAGRASDDAALGGHGDGGMSDCTERSEGRERMPKVGMA
jgi:hypothetical protein